MTTSDESPVTITDPDTVALDGLVHELITISDPKAVSSGPPAFPDDWQRQVRGIVARVLRLGMSAGFEKYAGPAPDDGERLETAVLEDYELVRVLHLFGVETDISTRGGDEDPIWVLERRVTEEGMGSPLIWTDFAPPEAAIREAAAEMGFFSGDQRTVIFTVTGRLPLQVMCEDCGKWGHASMADARRPGRSK